MSTQAPATTTAGIPEKAPNLALTQKVAAGSSQTNVKTVPGKLRVRVLDCLTGKPVTGCWVSLYKIGNDEIFNSSWYGERDIANCLPVIVAESDDEAGRQPLNPDGFTAARIDEIQVGRGKIKRKTVPENRRSLQVLLTRLGYKLGSPSKKFGKLGWAALEHFEKDWYANRNQAPPEKFVYAITAEWQARIIEEYNRRFYHAVQLYLSALGHPCTKDDGKWGADSKKALRRWQIVDLGLEDSNVIDGFCDFRDTQAEKQRKLAEKLRDCLKCYVTHKESGIASLPYPLERKFEETKVTIAFREFVVVAEKKEVLQRKLIDGLPVETPTGFTVEWYPSQDIAKGSWGWRLRAEDKANADRATLPEFNVNLEWTIPKTTDGDWKKLQRDQEGKAFSPHYLIGSDDKQAEIAVFAMIWCQPVWDGVENPPLSHQTNKRVSVQSRGHCPQGMHICTRGVDLGGLLPFGGKGYGMDESRNAPLHRGRTPPMTEEHALTVLRDQGYGVEEDRSGDESLHSSYLCESRRYAEEPQDTRDILQQAWLPEGERDPAQGALLTDEDYVYADTYHVVPAIYRFQHATGLSPSGLLDASTVAEIDKLNDYKRPAEMYGGWGHNGIDVHGLKGAPVFAVHGGSIVRRRRKKAGEWIYNYGDAGNTLNLKIPAPYYFTLQYLHLNDYVYPDELTSVRAGEIIAHMGRTGNLGDPSENPTHVHICTKWGGKTISTLPDDPLHKDLMPRNEIPLMFPCQCEVNTIDLAKHADQLNPTDKNPVYGHCDFANPHLVNMCWAVADLVCPYMLGGDDAKAKRRVRAQIRYLYFGQFSENDLTEEAERTMSCGKIRIRSVGETKRDSYHQKYGLIEPLHATAALDAKTQLAVFDLWRLIYQNGTAARPAKVGQCQIDAALRAQLDEVAPIVAPQEAAGT